MQAAPTSGSVVLTTVLSGAFLAAVITATISMWSARRKGREDERNRIRTAFAEAFAAYSAYKELPYAIRRRRADAPGEERVRLSEELREIQANLAYYVAWISVESESVGAAYANLVREMRRVAGSAMHDAWKAQPNDSDEGMNIPLSVIDLSALGEYETAYLNAVRDYLTGLAPWWGRRLPFRSTASARLGGPPRTSTTP
ncbi:hypothetical protein [Saccharothrix deserti]|uniref:hypothetical protein n=1 Tax=Saccharothrix deserti TaxID=2593674 RepID=UPI00131EC5D4|nr:hypothetical protein [Saccharothrix deserti]